MAFPIDRGKEPPVVVVVVVVEYPISFTTRPPRVPKTQFRARVFLFEKKKTRRERETLGGRFEARGVGAEAARLQPRVPATAPSAELASRPARDEEPRVFVAIGRVE